MADNPANTLDDAEKSQAKDHAAPGAIVIHEVIRKEGQEELDRRPGAVMWSGVTAGLSMGFSFLTLALFHSRLPDQPWRPLVDSLGYTVGFIITVLGRQQLFTESTLTAVLPVLVKRDMATLFALLRFWAIVLAANLVGTFLFAALIAQPGIFPDEVQTSLREIGHDAVSGLFWPTLVKAILAGWLIALMVWLLPSARSARLWVIIVLTYVVAMGRLSHIVAGSVEAAFMVVSGEGSAWDYGIGFFLPTLTGNVIGGVALVAMLNHAPLASELQSDG